MNDNVRLIITGRDYEQYVYDILNDAGFDAELTQESCDRGVDVLVRVGDEKIAIQCKLYSQPVGVDAVQQVHTGAMVYGCTKAFVVSPKPFTNQASQMAKVVGVEMVHHEKLVERFAEFRAVKAEERKEFAATEYLHQREDEKLRHEEEERQREEEERRLEEIVRQRVAEWQARRKQVQQKVDDLQALIAKCNEGDVEAMFVMARDGLAMEREINFDFDDLAAEARELGMVGEDFKIGHIEAQQAAYLAKLNLIEWSKRGNKTAQSKLMEFVKGRVNDAQIVSVFETAIKNGDAWVEPMKPWLAIYGIGN